MKKNLLYFFISLISAIVLAKYVGLAYIKIFNRPPGGSFGVEPTDSYRFIEGFELSFLFLISFFSVFSTNPKKFLALGAGWLVVILALLTAWEVLIIGVGLLLAGILIGRGIKKFK